MGTVYSDAGRATRCVEMLDWHDARGGSRPRRRWQKFNASRFDRVMLKTRRRKPRQRRRASSHFRQGEPGLSRMILVSVGRPPNGKKIGAESAGVTVNDRVASFRRLSNAHTTCRTSTPSATSRQSDARAQGGARGPRRGGSRGGPESHFDARVVPSVATTDPKLPGSALPRTKRRKQAGKSASRNSPGPPRGGRSPMRATKVSPS